MQMRYKFWHSPVFAANQELSTLNLWFFFFSDFVTHSHSQRKYEPGLRLFFTTTQLALATATSSEMAIYIKCSLSGLDSC